jgi:hypothetical protein
LNVIIGIMGVKDTLFFVPEDMAVTAVLGANVLSGLIPVPEYDTRLIWILKNKGAPPAFYSESLGVDLTCEVLIQ